MKDGDRLLTEVFDGTDLDASKEAIELRRVKNDLRQLKSDIPECQLSVERLRNAILSESAKRKTPWWSWSTAAAAGLACVLAIVLLRDSKTVQEPVSPKSTEKVKPETVAKVSPEGFDTEKVTSVSKPVVERRASRTKQPSVTKKIRQVKRIDRLDKPALMPADAVNAGAELARPPEPEPAVIVVDTQQDANTGAQQASEVTVPSDVVISG